MNNKENNSKECSYHGYKLSNMTTKDDIEIIGDDIDGVQLHIGCEDDNEFYTEEDSNGRVLIRILRDEPWDRRFNFDIDLEDLLRFAHINCNGIYERVGKEEIENVDTKLAKDNKK